MDLQYLRRLVKIFDDSSAAELEIEEEGIKLYMSKQNMGVMQNNMPVNYTQMQPYLPPTVQQPVINAVPPVQVQQPDTTNKPVEGDSPKVTIAEEESDFHVITSPIVGTFYRAPSPDSGPFVELGSHVSAGSTLCIIEAMKLMNEIESDVNGTISKILIENGQPVEYGQKMFLVKPD